MQIKATPFNNVVATGTATLKIESQNTITRIPLKLGGTTFTKAMITAIRVKLGSLLVWECTGSHLDDINDYRGLGSDSTILVIDFTEPNARTIQGYMLGGYDLKAIGLPMFVEVDISGATAPTLVAYPDITAEQGNDLIQQMLKYTFAPTTAAKHLLPLDARGGNVERIHLFHSNITDIEVKRGGYLLVDAPIAILQHTQKDFGNTPQSGHFCLDFVVDRAISNALRTVDAKGMREDVQVYVTTSAADTITVYAETLNRPR